MRKRVLVTGGAGFLGSHLCERLVAEARVLRVGNRVGVVSMRAFHPDAPGETVADGRGVYNIKRGASDAP